MSLKLIDAGVLFSYEIIMTFVEATVCQSYFITEPLNQVRSNIRNELKYFQFTVFSFHIFIFLILSLPFLSVFPPSLPSPPPCIEQIYLRFLDYEMANSNECKRNFVAVYDGGRWDIFNLSSWWIVRYTGAESGRGHTLHLGPLS